MINDTLKKFVIIGAAGYVAPRHMKAIKETDNELLAAMDPNDSIGIIDSYFPNADFFTEFERFDRHIEKLKRRSILIDYMSICTPNYLHDAHIRFGLRHGADVICEKPIVLNPWNIDALQQIEEETGKHIYNILQLRLHPAIISLKEEVEKTPEKSFDIDLTYITSRGKWYYASWKGNNQKSGGIATNIGVHFFDMLTWIFGPMKKNTVHINSHDRSCGYLELEKARVRWFLSINYETIPQKIKASGVRTYRSLMIDGREIEFSGGFTDLHTRSYERILNGKGYSMREAKSAIEIVHGIRNATAIGLNGDFHPLAKLPEVRHPFHR